MTRRAVGVVVLSTIGGIMLVIAIGMWATAVPAVATPPAARPGAPRPFVTTDRSVLDTAAAQLRDRNPFRSGRRPSGVRYNPWEPAPAAVAAPSQPSRAAPTLAGVIGGPPWNALVEGIPGREQGVVLALGDVVNGFRVVAFRGDTVLLHGQDTTWALTPRRRW